MPRLQSTHRGWARTKAAAHDIKLLPPRIQLAGWSSGDQLVYSFSPALLEVGQGGASPMRGWGAIIFVGMTGLALAYIFEAVPYFFQAWLDGESSIWELAFGLSMGVVLAVLLVVPYTYFTKNFLSVTDPTVRFSHKRRKVWMWTGKGPIEMDWYQLVPRVESSVATAYATVKKYRGQYAELTPDGHVKVSNGIPHVFQVGQISSAEEGVLPSMEYVRRYMESGPHAVQPPDKLLSHRPRWHAMVNFIGMADEWARWSENRDKPGVAPAPWLRTVIFIVLFPLFFPLQFTNWLALVVAPRPKWPKELEAMHEADRVQHQSEAISQERQSQTHSRATEAIHLRRKSVIRVNGEIVADDGHS